jgi:DNA repair protein RecN (Recombination protein N)
MLAELRVRDVATIADGTLSLGPGLTVLTGETGAGKSILDALGPLLAAATAVCGRAGRRRRGAFEGPPVRRVEASATDEGRLRSAAR